MAGKRGTLRRRRRCCRARPAWYGEAQTGWSL